MSDSRYSNEKTVIGLAITVLILAIVDSALVVLYLQQ
jgi:hypothetical protein